MPFGEAIRLAFQSLVSNKLRSFFTTLGIVVSVGFLVVVVAIIQGMNSYVSDTLTSSMIGKNTFQVRRGPISIGLMDDEQVRAIAKRPLVTVEDAKTVRRAVPEAVAVSLQSGWPTPVGEVAYRDRNVINVLVFGITPPFQVVQDYTFFAGGPLTEPDVSERRPVAVLGHEIADKLFDEPADAVGKRIRLDGHEVLVKGVVAPKGRLLGQSFDTFVLLPFSSFEAIYGRRKTTVVSVKMASADAIEGAMARAEEAMRVAHRLRPGEANDFTVDKADAFIQFWKNLTRLLFAAIPAVVAIGIVVGGHRHHEHHADDGERADPRNRHQEIARRDSGRHPVAVPGGGPRAHRYRGRPGRARRMGSLLRGHHVHPPARPNHRLVRRHRTRRRHGIRAGIRRLSRVPRLEARSHLRAQGGVGT